MEYLGVLEKKIGALVDSKKLDSKRIAELEKQIEELRAENSELLEQLTADSSAELKTQVEALGEEKETLLRQVEKLEDSLLARHQNVEALTQEKELTRMAVDDLIKDIDSIVGE